MGLMGTGERGIGKYEREKRESVEARRIGFF